MNINGTKVDVTGIKFNTRTHTIDPIQYHACAVTYINGLQYVGEYNGEVGESRVDCKKGAYISLRADAKKRGIII